MKARNFVDQHRGDSVQLSPESLRQLDDPSFREEILRAIHRDPTSDAGGLLRHLLDLEVADRKANNSGEYFENLDWCGFLLYRVGDVRDVLTLWRAKQTNFDTGCNFDAQFLVGAGVDETIAYLRASSETDAAAALDYLLECQASGVFANLEEWRQWRLAYFR
jgi:hypothetical protein